MEIIVWKLFKDTIVEENQVHVTNQKRVKEVMTKKEVPSKYLRSY